MGKYVTDLWNKLSNLLAMVVIILFILIHLANNALTITKDSFTFSKTPDIGLTDGGPGVY